MQSGLPTSTGETLLVNPYGEPYLYEVNRDTFTRTGAEAVFRRHFGESLLEENRFHVIVGTDSGLLPAYVQSRELPKGSRFLFVELPEVLASLRRRGLVDEAQAHIRFATPDDWFNLAEAQGLTDYIYVDGARVQRSLAAADAFLPQYRLVRQAVQERFDSRCWEIMQGLGTAYFLDKSLRNLAENRHPAVLLRHDNFKGKTAMLLAGGPSLDTLLPWVQTHRDEVAVIAVSRVCRRLQEVGITPDIVVSIDPTHLSFDISKELLHFSDDVVLVNADHVAPDLVGQWHGRNFYLGAPYPWDTPLNPENMQTIGPTVTNSALLLASDMGFAQVVLGGVDLCLSPEGFSHAQGSNEHRAGPLLGHIGIAVETNDGRQAETRHDFAHAIQSLSVQAAIAARFGCRVINPAPGAARIEHVDFVALDAIELQPLDRPARDIIAQCLPQDDSEARAKAWRGMLEELRRIDYSLERIAELADEAIENNRQLFSETGSPRHKKQLHRIEQELDDKHQAAVTFLKKYALKDFLKLTRPDEEMEWSDEEGEQTAHRYYEILRDTARKLLTDLGKVQTRVRSRLEEEALQPDLEKLIQQWRQDRQPGRANVWRQRHPAAGAKLTAQDRAQLDALTREFEDVLADQNTRHARKVAEECDLDTVRSKAQLLFMQQERDGLAHLHAGLTALPATQAAPYRAITEGYLAELDHRPDTAIQAYQSITAGPLLEDALQRIAWLSLDRHDLENAGLALDCLSHLSPSYLSQLGDVLRLQGELPQAADAYTRYLDNAPDDLATAIKLAQLHIDVGNTGIAVQIFDYVLDKEPNNKAARQLRDSLEKTA